MKTQPLPNVFGIPKSSLIYISCLVGLTHLVLWLLGIWSIEIINDTAAYPSWQSFTHWNRWDTPHYLDLARDGYSNNGELGLFIVFFPAYPAMIKVLDWMVGDLFTCAVLISTFSLIAACIALHKIIEHYSDAETARRSIWYMLIFPSAYAFHIGYTESLFMATLLWLWVAMLEKKWVLVGGLGLLLCATRINGALIGLVVGWQILHQWWMSKQFDPAWLWTALIPCGLAIYLAINYWQYDNALHFLEVQRNHWHKSPGTPLTALTDLWNRLSYWDNSKYWTLGIFEIAAVVLGAIASIYAFLRMGVGAGLWASSNLLLITSTGWAMSLPRYILVIFPLFMLMAELSRRPVLKAGLDLFCLSCFTMMSLQFARGQWGF